MTNKDRAGLEVDEVKVHCAVPTVQAVHTIYTFTHELALKG